MPTNAFSRWQSILGLVDETLQFSYAVEDHEIYIVRLKGALDVFTVMPIRSLLKDIATAGSQVKIILDLEHLVPIDSSGFWMLLNFKTHFCILPSNEFILTCLSRHGEYIFRMVRLIALFRVRKTIEMAKEHMKNS